MVTKEWVAIHRKHHAKCETPDDPHSPQTRGIKTVFWSGAELYRDRIEEPGDARASYGHGTPDDWIERNVYTRFTWQGVGLMLVVDLLLFGAIGADDLGGPDDVDPVHRRRRHQRHRPLLGLPQFRRARRQHQHLPVGHPDRRRGAAQQPPRLPTSAKFSSQWYEFDIGWMYIRVLQALGLAKVRSVAPVPKFVAEARDRPRDAAGRHHAPLRRLVQLRAQSRATPTAPNSRSLEVPEAERARFAGLKRLAAQAMMSPRCRPSSSGRCRT